MSSSESFHDLQTRLCAGDDAAATEVFRRYAQRLVALARCRLDERLRQKIDPEDVVQSVFRSFFVRCLDGRFDFAHPDNLWSLLVRFTIFKCCQRSDHFQAACRDVRREVATGTEAATLTVAEIVDLEPGPEEVVLVTDTVEEVMRRLDSPLQRKIFELSLQGHSVAEISAQVGYYEKGVERVRRKIRLLLEQMGES